MILVYLHCSINIIYSSYILHLIIVIRVRHVLDLLLEVLGVLGDDLLELLGVLGKLDEEINLQIVNIVTQNNERVQRLTRLVLSKLPQRTGLDALPGRSQSRNGNGRSISTVHLLVSHLLNLKQLLSSLLNRHVSGRLKDVSASHDVLNALLLDLDIQQHQSVQTNLSVLVDLVVERIGLPRVSEENQRHGLAKVVQLQTASTNSVHNRGIVDGLVLDSELSGSNDQVSMGGGSKGITNNEECNVVLLGTSEDVVGGLLDHLSVSKNQLLAVKLLQSLLLGSHENGGVGLEIDSLALFDGLQTPDGDVGFVGQSQANQMKHFCV